MILTYNDREMLVILVGEAEADAFFHQRINKLETSYNISLTVERPFELLEVLSDSFAATHMTNPLVATILANMSNKDNPNLYLTTDEFVRVEAELHRFFNLATFLVVDVAMDDETPFVMFASGGKALIPTRLADPAIVSLFPKEKAHAQDDEIRPDSTIPSDEDDSAQTSD